MTAHSGRPSGFRTLSSEIVHHGFMTEVRSDRLLAPDGDEVTREIYAHVDAVGIVPVDADRQVVLVRQYRHAIGGHILEIPAGMLDVEGEDAQMAAARELAEEVGLAADTWRELAAFHNSAGWTDETTTLYLATGLRAIGPPEGFSAAAEEADMEVLRMDLVEAAALVRAGQVPDAKTALGLLLAEAAHEV